MTTTTIDRIRRMLEWDLRTAEACLSAARRDGARLDEPQAEQTAAIAALSEFIAVHGVGTP